MMEVFDILAFFAPVDIDEDGLYVGSKCRQVLGGHAFSDFDIMKILYEYSLDLFWKIVDGDGENVELKLPFQQGFNFVAVYLLTK